MKAKGMVKLRVNGQWREVEQYHRWTVRVGDSKFPVEFALHLCPIGGRALKVSEVSTGCDTGAQVLDPRSGRVIELHNLNKRHRLYLPGHEVRKLARNAAHRLIKRVGAQQFLYAIAAAALARATKSAQEPAQ